MTMKFDMPTLTAEEKALLTSASDPVKRAQLVLDKLARIGVDTSEHQARVDQVEQLRAGLLTEFGSQRPRRA